LPNGEELSFESELKNRVAREAAALLYCGAEKEYKQAKQKAASTFGTHFLPSNREVALELNNIAEENEGPKRNERLVKMRREALNVMELLEEFFPVLVGSVWRGTIKRGSDIDIAVFVDEPLVVSEVLKVAGVRVLKNNWVYVNKGGETLASFHIYAETQSEHGLEIVVRGCEEKGKRRRCETFGDEMKGLNLRELKRTLKTNPTQQFIPR
jgi:hypothetical protein